MTKLILVLALISNMIGLVASVYFAVVLEPVFLLVAIGLLFSLIIIGELIRLLDNVKFLMRDSKAKSKEIKKLSEQLKKFSE